MQDRDLFDETVNRDCIHKQVKEFLSNLERKTRRIAVETALKAQIKSPSPQREIETQPEVQPNFRSPEKKSGSEDPLTRHEVNSENSDQQKGSDSNESLHLSVLYQPKRN